MRWVATAFLLSIGLMPLAAPASAEPRLEHWHRAMADARSDRPSERHRFERGDRTVLPQSRIERIVRRGGFAEIEEVRLRRDRYVVTAVRPNGAVFRLALDARDGDVIGSERIGWAKGYDRRDYDRARPASAGSHGPFGR